MKARHEHKKRQIPEALGNRANGVWLYIAVLAVNAVAHIVLFFSYGMSVQSLLRLFFSFMFFIYPLCYLADVLWSLHPSIRRILSGEIAINRKYYMNSVQKEIARDALLPVTISIPVYKESNDIIFETFRKSLEAVRRYREFSGANANVVVSDDGLAPLLGGSCSKETAERILKALEANDGSLTPQEQMAAERIRFYRDNGIAFVARPAQGRAGLFKKASNLNYTLRLSKVAPGGLVTENVFDEGGAFEGGYAEGSVTVYEVILLLDKDSGIKDRIIEAVLPEFAVDDKLAYVQCATKTDNLYENYYSSSTGHQTNNLFHNIWPCKALQGFFVPLVGHNVFLRKSMLEKCGLWAEDRVSEDYDMAIRLYGNGYHGKYAQLRGLEFSESASRTFTEETNKQRRYAYGLFEMIFDGTISRKQARPCDIFYMLLYFFSVVNQTLLFPTVLLENYFGNIHLLWAGFLLCMLCFVVAPLSRSVLTRRLQPEEHEGIGHSLLISLSFLGHSYSIFIGSCRYLVNKIKKINRPFPSTNVDQLEYRFRDGLKILLDFFKKNPMFIAISFLCLDRGIYLLTRKGLELATVFTYGYILFGIVLVPILLTPQLFAGLGGKKAETGQTGARRMIKHKEKTPASTRGMRSESLLSPYVTESEPYSAGLSEEQFLSAYEEMLRSSLPEDDMPAELLEDYSFESCIRKDQDGKKELYLLRRKTDGAMALLRVTDDNPDEDALEEAMLLQKLDHPGIPKVYGFMERNGKKYLVREYIEGRTLSDIVSAGGSLGTDDIFDIGLKLADILCYLHGQNPPVIHRDIKPQNIVVGKDGSIHLIDFGIARVHKQQRERDTSVILTLDYASPEQFGFEQTTPVSDIYSLGVVLLYLATGRTIRSDLEAQIVNNRLRNLIGQCIDFNPKMRIQSAEEIRRYILRGSRRQKNRGRRIFVTAAAMLGAAAVLGGLSYWMSFRTERDASVERGYDLGYEEGYTDGYRSVPVFLRSDGANPVNTGTDPANMAVPGGAFAIQSGGLTFYIADGDVWRVNANGTEPVRMTEDEKASAISCWNDWLYYSSGDRILQKNLYTPQSDVLYKGMSGRLYIREDELYILSDGGVYQLDYKTGKATELKELAGCEILTIGETEMYFVDGTDHGLYRWKGEGTAREKLAAGSFRSICLYNNRLFCAMSENGTERLVRIDPQTGAVTELLEAQARMLHITEDGIYFIDQTEETIIRCSFDGRIRERITGNRAGDFNIAGSWIYYHNKDDGGSLWSVRLDGANDHPVRPEG
ncbi:MAG: protein kinase [Oscillospiraceae bacterium]|nr:protein kinase [Oscillospiraceae bacterium]